MTHAETNDFINGLIEFTGSLFLFWNCYSVWKDKDVKGVSVLSTAFFAIWGGWNIYFYPSLHQWYSFTGGLFIVTANILWISLMIKYRK